MIIFSGIEWDYDNLEGIGYNSDTLLEPYATWFYQITGALNHENDLISLQLTDEGETSSIYQSKEPVIRFSDYSQRIINRVNSENISVQDVGCRKVLRQNEEEFELSDKRVAHLNSLFKEPVLYFLDEASYTYQRWEGGSPVGPEITVDQVELSGSACLFDFEANDDVWSQSDFTAWCADNCPVNYNELRPFIPGEYEYERAYVGFKLTIPPTGGRFGVAHSTVYVDVEDVVGKGTCEHTWDNDNSRWIIYGCEINGDEATVTFSKRFYTIPHVVPSLNFSQDNCFIEVTSRSRDYFKFKIKSISSGNYVTSSVAWSINWLADGY